MPYTYHVIDSVGLLDPASRWWVQDDGVLDRWVGQVVQVGVIFQARSLDGYRVSEVNYTTRDAAAAFLTAFNGG